MDLVEISPKMAEISLDLKNFAENCSFISLVGFLRVLGRKPANRPMVFGFWRQKLAADCHWCRVSRFLGRIGRVGRVGRLLITVGHPESQLPY